MAFKYVNVNPSGAKTDDCINRAISLASGLDYYDVQEKLVLTSKLFGCDRLTRDCYSNLLEKVFNYIPVYCKGMTVDEFCLEYPYGIYLVRMKSHITCVIDGVINDTWNCGSEFATNAWYVP